MIETDVLIIGAGPVGIFTAFQAGMLGMRSVIIDAGHEIGGQCSALYPEKPIYDIPAFTKISAGELIENLRQQADYFKPQYLLEEIVTNLTMQEDCIKIQTHSNKEISAKVVIIAAGNGRIKHKKIPLDNATEFEGKTLFYSIKEKESFRNKNIIIAGGGDSAVDWANELANICRKIYIIHRREKFSCLEQSYIKLLENCEKNLVEIVAPYQLHKLKGVDGNLTAIEVIDFDKCTKEIETDYLLAFYGLDSNFGEIENWTLELEKRHLQTHIRVNPATMETSLKRIFAIGDSCIYPGKLKLILTGFAESAIACHNSYNFVFKDKKLHFEHSTTKGLHKI